MPVPAATVSTASRSVIGGQSSWAASGRQPERWGSTSCSSTRSARRDLVGRGHEVLVPGDDDRHLVVQRDDVHPLAVDGERTSAMSRVPSRSRASCSASVIGTSSSGSRGKRSRHTPAHLSGVAPVTNPTRITAPGLTRRDPARRLGLGQRDGDAPVLLATSLGVVAGDRVVLAVPDGADEDLVVAEPGPQVLRHRLARRLRQLPAALRRAQVVGVAVDVDRALRASPREPVRRSCRSPPWRRRRGRRCPWGTRGRTSGRRSACRSWSRPASWSSSASASGRSSSASWWACRRPCSVRPTGPACGLSPAVRRCRRDRSTSCPPRSRPPGPSRGGPGAARGDAARPPRRGRTAAGSGGVAAIGDGLGAALGSASGSGSGMRASGTGAAWAYSVSMWRLEPSS